MSGRQDKVAMAIRKEIATLVLHEMRDPRLVHVTITGAEVSRDWSVAKVHVSALGDEKALKEAVGALNDAKGYVRHQIAPHLTLRHVPELEFVPDDTARKAQRLEEIFRDHAREEGEGDAQP